METPTPIPIWEVFEGEALGAEEGVDRAEGDADVEDSESGDAGGSEVGVVDILVVEEAEEEADVLFQR